MARAKKITVKHIQKSNAKEQLSSLNTYSSLYPNLGLPAMYLRLRYDNIQADIKSFYAEFAASFLTKEKQEMLHFSGSYDTEKFELERTLVSEEVQNEARKLEIEAVKTIVRSYLDKGINIINNKPSKYIEYNIYKLEDVVDNIVKQKLLVDLNKKSNNLFLRLLFDSSPVRFSELFTFLKDVSTSADAVTDFYQETLQPYECFFTFTTGRDDISQMRVFEWKNTDLSSIKKGLSDNYGTTDSQRIIGEIEYAINENEEILKIQ
ncbi:MAG: hypothetical protein RIG77_08600 [Cyclobacteriaceae bacterium]